MGGGRGVGRSAGLRGSPANRKHTHLAHALHTHPSLTRFQRTRPTPTRPQFTGDWIDLERWYSDLKKRERSYAVKISKYLRARSVGIAG
jgi:hypothetical protein